MLVGKSFSTSRFKDAQRFSIGLRSGEYFGKLKRITPLSSSQSRTASALWIGLLSWSRFHAWSGQVRRAYWISSALNIPMSLVESRLPLHESYVKGYGFYELR
jgi:hypothetical protein